MQLYWKIVGKPYFSGGNYDFEWVFVGFHGRFVGFEWFLLGLCFECVLKSDLGISYFLDTIGFVCWME